MSEGSSSQAGFYYQNMLAGLKLLDLLHRKSDIQYIQLENFKKGPHIDDVIVVRRDQVDFYQVKWSEDENNAFTLYNIIYQATEDDQGTAKKTLWEKLVKGYNESQTDGKPATITLYSTRPAGNNKKPSAGINKSLKELIAFHNRVLKDPETELEDFEGYGGFEPLFKKIITDKGPDADRFEAFFKSLRFELGMPDLQTIEDQLDHKLRNLGMDTAMAGRLLKLVVQWSISGEQINKSTLEKALGLNSRFEDRIPNTFKVNDALYIENAELFSQLDKALASNEGGFILVEGVPGAGKSTALTKYFEKSRDVHFSYYCFLPEDAYTTNQRMQGKYFLKSLCIAIENAFREDESLPHRLSENYEEIFSEYTEFLGKMDKRIMILVDGLDHVHRSLDALSNPLTEVLPRSLPENVYFIISSQYLAALPRTLQAVISADPEKRIFMSRFGPGQVHAYIKRKGLELSTEQEQLLLKRSEGIPLYLHYITESLVDQLPGDIQSIIGSYPELENGNISTYHNLLYQQILADENANWIFGLLARRRTFSSTGLLQKIISFAGRQIDLIQAENTIDRFRYLLKERDGNSYAIFHNSFREFLLEKTQSLDATFSNAQAAYYADDLFEFEAFNSYFDLLFKAGRFPEITSAATDQWITMAWKRRRSPDEILENLQIAWKASVEMDDVKELIRIGFLIAQVGAMKSMMENTGVDTTMLFLHARLSRDSLGTIWDGEFTHLFNPNFFNYYVYRFAEITGGTIPEVIAGQFFQRFLQQSADSEDNDKEMSFADYFNARTLYLSPQAWTAELRGFQITIADEDKNEIIHFLASKKLLSYLLAFYESETELTIKNLAAALLTSSLASQQSEEFRQYLAMMDFTTLSDQGKTEFAIAMIRCGHQAELAGLWDKFEPTLFIQQEIMEKEPHYRVAPGMLQLFDRLKVRYAKDERNYALTELQFSGLGDYPGRLYRAFSTAAKLWSQWQTDGHQRIAVDQLKSVVDLMLVSKYEGENLINHLNRAHFIIYHIHELYRQLFAFFKEVCNISDLKILTDYWMQRHPFAGIQRFESDLEFAETLQGINELQGSAALLIADAEVLARGNDGTSTLVTDLYKIADSFGKLGLIDDFDRVYMDLLPLSCGIGDRKDYQFVSIIPLLGEVHQVQPEQTLERFAEIYELLYQVGDVADQTIKSRSFGALIKFMAGIYPELAFKLLETNEPEIQRDEVMDGMLGELIEKSTAQDLPLIWAMINTMNRWEHFGNEQDSHVHSLHVAFFEKLSTSSDISFIQTAYQQAFYQFEVEQDNPYKIEKINAILEASGKTFPFLCHPAPPEQKDIPRGEWTQPADPIVRFILKNPKKSREELLTATQLDFSSLAQYVDGYLNISLINRVGPLWHTFYAESVGFFKDWFVQIPQEQLSAFRLALFTWQRKFLREKPDIAANWHKAVNAFTPSMDIVFGEALVDFEGFGLREFLNGRRLDSKKASRRLYLGSGQSASANWAIADADILWMAERVAAKDVDKWAGFITNRFSKGTITKCLLAFAKTAKVWDLGRATGLVEQAFEYADNRMSSDKTVIEELLELYYTLAPDKAKHRVLQLFVAGHYDYTYDVRYDLWKYIKPWIPRFNDSTIYPAYYQANLDYNRKLAEGLQVSTVRAEFIRNHRETKNSNSIVTGYLIGLFDYPVVKIRESALSSICTVFPFIKSEIKAFAIEKLQDASPNTIEHFLVMLHALSEKDPEYVAELINGFAWMFELQHFNILESLREITLLLMEKGSKVIKAMISAAEKVNMAPLVSSPGLLRLNLPGPMRSFSNYQQHLINDLDQLKTSGESFAGLLHQMRIDEGYTYASGLETEKQFHGHYNLNSNFDPIEINGSVYQQTHNAINKLLAKEISSGNMEDEDVEAIKHDFRLYDPGDFLTQRDKRPAEISYLTKDITTDTFLNFGDMDELIASILTRNERMITIFESGQDWHEGYPDHFNTEFILSLFLTRPGTDQKELQKIFKDYAPYYTTTNLYRTELIDHYTISKRPEKIKNLIYPLVGTSRKNFRSRWLDSLAVFLPHIARKLQLKVDPTLNWSSPDETKMATWTEWQGSFKDYGRRRLEPNSFGSTLQLDRNVLKTILEKEKMDLNIHLTLRRTTDKYKPTAKLNWVSRTEVRQITSLI